MSKRIIAAILSIVMLLGMLPVTALAMQSPVETAQTTGTTVPAEANDEISEPTEETTPVEPAEITRAQWVQALVATFDMTVEEDNYPDNYFSDLTGEEEYYRDILVAVEFGVIDIEAGLPFDPEAAATREFAAHTLNYCLGFQLEEAAYSYSEAETVTYPDDVQIAVNRGWFEVVDGAFLPEQPITEAEMTAMLADAAEVLASDVIDESYESSYEFSEEVIELPENTVAQLNSDTELLLASPATPIAQGDIFVVYLDGFPVVYQADAVAVSGSLYTVTVTNLSINDYLLSVDAQGSMDADLADFEVAEGLEAIYVLEDGTEVADARAAGTQKIKSIYFYDSLLGFSISVELYDMQLKWKASGKSLNDANVTAVVTGKADCSVTCPYGVTTEDVFDTLVLGKVPIGYFGSITVSLDLTVEGNISIAYNTDFGVGYSYSVTNGHRLIVNLHKRYFSLTAEVNLDIALTAQIGLDNIPLLSAGLYASVGMHTNCTVRYRGDNSTPKLCIHTDSWLYAQAGVKATVGIKGITPLQKTWSNDIVLWDRNTSPVRSVSHFEDGTLVDNCSCGDTYFGGYNSYYYSSSGSKYANGGVSSVYNAPTYTYTTDDAGNATITGYSGAVSSLSIPSTIDGYPVTAIGNSAFSGNTSLYSVTIPAGVVTIGASAFKNCTGLRNVTMPDTVTTIGNNAFESCTNLLRIDVPDTVTVIGNYAFSNCNTLQAVTLSKSLKDLGYGSFGNCTGLTTIEIPKSLTTTYTYWDNSQNGPFIACRNLKKVIFEEGTTKIPQYLFANCTGLETIVIPDTVITIEQYAFYRCTSLTTVDISDAVTVIGNYAFSNCNALQTVTLSKSLKDLGYGSFGNCTGLTTIEIPKSLTTTYAYWDNSQNGPFIACSNLKTVIFEEGATEIPQYLFANCTGLETIVIPDTVTMVEQYAFYGAKNLTNVTLSNSLVTIANNAFDCCTTLTTVDIPDTVTVVGNYAFSSCTALQAVTLSKSLKDLGYGAFGNCAGLTTIEIPKSLATTYTYWDNSQNGPFIACRNLKTVIFEEGTTKIPQYLFANCTGLESIVIPDTVTTIEQYAFYRCTSLTTVDISDAVTVIGNYAFSNCTALQVVTLSKSLKDLGYGSFGNCTGLTTIEIPKSLTTTYTYWDNSQNGPFIACSNLKTVTFEEGTTEITQYLFANCTGPEAIIIPDTVKSIEKYAFFNASQLKSIDIPASVTTIGTHSFTDSTALTTVCWDSVLTAIPEYTFSGCTALTTVNLPDNLMTINKYAFNNCDALVTFTMPDSVATMAENVFYDCDALTDIHLSANLQKINNNTFYDCDALTSITIPYGVTSVGNSAFYDCDALETVNMANSVTSLGTNVFYHNDVLKNVKLSRNLTSIPSGTFKECALLEEIVIPYFATSIGDNAFNSSPKLTKVVTHDKLTSISTSAFSYADVTQFYGTAGSATETWCTENGYTFVENTAAATAVTPVSTTVRLNKGSTYMLDFDIAPADFCENIIWKSGNTGVATVTEAGLITGVDVGTTKLKVGVGSATASVTVIVEQPVTSLKLNVSSLELDVPDTYQLTATILPADATNTTLKWTSSDESVAAVNENGLITAIGNGTATITAATTDGTNLTAKCTVKVTDPSNIPVSGITLNVSSLTMEALDTHQLTATVAPANAANQTIRWTSSNEAVATVDANGMVTARGKGTAVITAASTDGTNITAACTVTVTNNAHIVTDPAKLESGHPYDVNCTDFWIYTDEGAESLTITFDAQTEIEDGFDYLRIYDGAGNLIGEYTGKELAGSTVEIPGDTVKIQIISDEFDAAWGFKVNNVEADKPGGDYTVSWTQASISLAGDIGVNYYAQLSEDLVNASGAYIRFTVAGQPQTVPVSEAEVSTDANGVTTYRFTCRVAAKQMTENITGQMYLADGTAVGDAKVYSVKAYCDAAIPVYSQYEAYADLVGLLEAMLNYGAYSQIQFGCNTDNLANSNLTDTALPSITAADVDAYAHGATGFESGISVASVSLLLESTTTIRFYFNLDGSKSIDEYTFYVDGVETVPVESNGQYYVDKVNVAAKDLDEMVTVTVGGLTARYCGLSYVRQVAVLYPSYYSEALVNVAKALYAYNQAANAYFA